MYEVIKNVIESLRFELKDMLAKIDTIWLQGDITDDEKEELVDLAREKADPENSYAQIQDQIEQIFAQLSGLDARVKTLETEGGGTDPEPEPDEYPEYVQPSGAHDAYHKDDKITFGGEKYICIAPDGVAVVWNPDTYPAYWQKVEE